MGGWGTRTPNLSSAEGGLGLGSQSLEPKAGAAAGSLDEPPHREGDSLSLVPARLPKGLSSPAQWE